MINGSDWASYQGPAPDTSGLDFVFIKVTQGLTYENPYWQQQVDVARRAGLVIGLYHYPDMANGAGVECEHFCTVAANALSADPTRMAMLDWEGYDQTNQGVSHAEQAAYKDAFLEHLGILRPLNRSVLYANLDYWRNIDTTGKHGDALFIATAGLPAGHPGIASPWLFHQYGTRGGVDADVANFPSRAALAAWANKQEADMALTPDEIKAIGQAAADAVWAHIEKDAENGQDVRMGAVMAWMDRIHGNQTRALGDIETALKALPAGGPTAEELMAAAKAGAVAGIDQVLANLATIKPAAATV